MRSGRNDSLDDAPRTRPPLSVDGNASLVACSAGVFDQSLAWAASFRSGICFIPGLRASGTGCGISKTTSPIACRSIRGDLGQVAQAINRMAERRAALEEKLRQQDRLAALGKVVAGVAHEVRNPLNSIKLTLQLLDRRLKKGIAASNEVEECLQEIDRLDMIVGRLLAFGRPVMTNRHMQEIEPLIHQAIKMVHEPMQQKSVQIHGQRSGEGPDAQMSMGLRSSRCSSTCCSMPSKRLRLPERCD